MPDTLNQPSALASCAPPANDAKRNRPHNLSTAFGWLGRTLPPVLVFTTLAGLLAWGIKTGWSVPSFSTITGTAPGHSEIWCEAHNVAEAECVECNANLMPRPKEFGWCKVHGVHECPLCHPELAQTAKPAQVTTADLERARQSLAFAERPVNNSKCKLYGRRIQFASVAAVDRTGVDVEPVGRAPVVEFVSGSGEITYDQTRTARLSVRVPGMVFWALKQVGDAVRRGEVVALVDATEVGRAKSDLLQALAQIRLRTKVLGRFGTTGADSVPERVILEAETALSEARIRLATAQQLLSNLGLPMDTDALASIEEEKLANHLRFLGLPKSLIESLDPKPTTANLLPVVAPFDGLIVTRDVVAGEVVDNTKVLFVIVDVRQMWLNLDLRLEDARRVSLGQPIRFRPDGGKEEAKAAVTWISTEADHKTRTVKVRAVLTNTDGRMKANTFGAGRVVLREEREAIVVPSAAIHWEGDCHVVFVRDKNFLKGGSPKVFHTRVVRTGASDGESTEIVAGVLPGELVAVKGSAALRAELLRGNLGEG